MVNLFGGDDDFLALPKFRRSDYFSFGIFTAFLIASVFFIGLLASPFLVPAGTVDFGETGKTGITEFSDEIDAMNNSVARFYYNLGDLNCHQMASRSFFLNDNQLPFCARDTAIFLGMAIGLFICLFLVFEFNLWLLVIGFGPIGLDGGIQLITDYESINSIRFATGLLAGIVTAILLATIIVETSGIMRYRKERKIIEKGN